MDQKTQLEVFTRAVAALGGQQATARALDMSDRSVRMLLSGDRRLHAGILEDMADALVAHADLCRKLERQLSPAFAGNLTPANRPPLHSGKPMTLMDKLRRELAKARDAGNTPEHWIFSHSFCARLMDELDNPRATIVDGNTLFDLPIEVTKDENLHERGYALVMLED